MDRPIPISRHGTFKMASDVCQRAIMLQTLETLRGKPLSQIIDKLLPDILGAITESPPVCVGDFADSIVYFAYKHLNAQAEEYQFNASAEQVRSRLIGSVPYYRAATAYQMDPKSETAKSLFFYSHNVRLTQNTSLDIWKNVERPASVVPPSRIAATEGINLATRDADAIITNMQAEYDTVRALRPQQLRGATISAEDIYASYNAIVQRVIGAYRAMRDELTDVNHQAELQRHIVTFEAALAAGVYARNIDDGRVALRNVIGDIETAVANGTAAVFAATGQAQTAAQATTVAQQALLDATNNLADLTVKVNDMLALLTMYAALVAREDDEPNTTEAVRLFVDAATAVMNAQDQTARNAAFATLQALVTGTTKNQSFYDYSVDPKAPADRKQALVFITAQGGWTKVQTDLTDLQTQLQQAQQTLKQEQQKTANLNTQLTTAQQDAKKWEQDFIALDTTHKQSQHDKTILAQEKMALEQDKIKLEAAYNALQNAMTSIGANVQLMSQNTAATAGGTGITSGPTTEIKKLVAAINIFFTDIMSALSKVAPTLPVPANDADAVASISSLLNQLKTDIGTKITQQAAELLKAQADLTDESKKLAAAEKDLKDAQAKIAKLQGEVAQLQTDLGVVTTERDDLRTRYTANENAINGANGWNDRLAQATSDLTTTQTQLKLVERERDDANQKALNSAAELTAKSDELDKATQELEAAKKDVQRLQNEVQTLTADKDRMEKDLKTKVQELQSRLLQGAQSFNADTAKQLRQLAIEKQEIEDKLQDTERTLSKTTDDLRDAAIKVASLQAIKVEMDQATKSLLEDFVKRLGIIANNASSNTFDATEVARLVSMLQSGVLSAFNKIGIDTSTYSAASAGSTGAGNAAATAGPKPPASPPPIIPPFSSSTPTASPSGGARESSFGSSASSSGRSTPNTSGATAGPTVTQEASREDSFAFLRRNSMFYGDNGMIFEDLAGARNLQLGEHIAHLTLISQNIKKTLAANGVDQLSPDAAKYVMDLCEKEIEVCKLLQAQILKDDGMSVEELLGAREKIISPSSSDKGKVDDWEAAIEAVIGKEGKEQRDAFKQFSTCLHSDVISGEVFNASGAEIQREVFLVETDNVVTNIMAATSYDVNNKHEMLDGYVDTLNRNRESLIAAENDATATRQAAVYSKLIRWLTAETELYAFCSGYKIVEVNGEYEATEDSSIEFDVSASLSTKQANLATITRLLAKRVETFNEFIGKDNVAMMFSKDKATKDAIELLLHDADKNNETENGGRFFSDSQITPPAKVTGNPAKSATATSAAAAAAGATANARAAGSFTPPPSATQPLPPPHWLEGIENGVVNWAIAYKDIIKDKNPTKKDTDEMLKAKANVISTAQGSDVAYEAYIKLAIPKVTEYDEAIRDIINSINYSAYRKTDTSAAAAKFIQLMGKCQEVVNAWKNALAKMQERNSKELSKGQKSALSRKLPSLINDFEDKRKKLEPLEQDFFKAYNKPLPSGVSETRRVKPPKSTSASSSLNASLTSPVKPPASSKPAFTEDEQKDFNRLAVLTAMDETGKQPIRFMPELIDTLSNIEEVNLMDKTYTQDKGFQDVVNSWRVYISSIYNEERAAEDIRRKYTADNRIHDIATKKFEWLFAFRNTLRLLLERIDTLLAAPDINLMDGQQRADLNKTKSKEGRKMNSIKELYNKFAREVGWQEQSLTFGSP